MIGLIPQFLQLVAVRRRRESTHGWAYNGHGRRLEEEGLTTTTAMVSRKLFLEDEADGAVFCFVSSCGFFARGKKIPGRIN